MALKDLLKEIDTEVGTVNSSAFDVEIIETKHVPSFDDPNITYDNLDKNKKKCKRLESCVLYVDIRDSAKISAERRPKTLARIYSSFVRSMIRCATNYGGHVRNIIGDRVMVVFDQDDCFGKAVDTAILMNTVGQYILNKRITALEFRAGIGIDYGPMLITKGGAIRHGSEKEFYRGLVWLGKPANIASRLTDLAFKEETSSIPGVREGFYYPYTAKWSWYDSTYEDFVDKLQPTHSKTLIHENEYFNTFFKTSLSPYTSRNPPIFMTEAVFSGFKRARSDTDSIKKNWWTKQSINVKDYEGVVYGGDVYKAAIEAI